MCTFASKTSTMGSDHRIYGLVGKKLGHSFSRDFFGEKFKKEGINAEYVNYEIPTINQFPEIIKATPGIAGLNVTIPYKESVIQFLDALAPMAARIGAVNTIQITRTESGVRLTGHNTDIIGFTESIRPHLVKPHRKALMLGSGGAAKAMRAGLETLGLTIESVSRHAGQSDYTYEDLTPEIIQEHTVIVNATPLGMWPETETAPDIPYGAIGPEHVIFDAVYNPDPTLFLKKCQEQGADVISGIGMLHGQAIAAWKIWNGKTLISE